MKVVYYLLLALMPVLSISSCELFEDDECDKTDKPEKVFDFYAKGTIYEAQGVETKDGIILKLSITKVHCRDGKESGPFEYTCRSNENGIMYCGLGYHYGFSFNNSWDFLRITYLSEGGLSFGNDYIYYADIPGCPTYPARGKVTLDFNMDYKYDAVYDLHDFTYKSSTVSCSN